MEHSITVDILTSLQQLFVDYIPAAVVGIFIGLIIGFNSFIYQIFYRLLQIPRSVVSIAFLPLALITFKQPETAAFIVVFISAVWAIIMDTGKGVQQYQLHRNDFRIAVYHTFNGLRIGIWLAWFTVIATEMLIGQQGLGFVVWDAYKASNRNYIINVLIYIGLIGFILDQLLDIAGYLLSQIVADGRQTDS